MAAARFNAKNFPSLTPFVITENSRTVLPSPSFLARRSGSGDFSSAMLPWSRYANAFCSTHFVGWALLETNFQSCQDSPEQCPPTRVSIAGFQLPNIPEWSSTDLVGWALLETNPQPCRN
ncbi:hypothetical protein [Moorena producens]|uniref:hypothetical protein n=1 Tax=Moorena producens TaxID=1155739 RepID=UPI003C7336F9